MKKEWKDRWVKALRSKKYRQSRQVLRKPRGGYCCLGVLCDLVDPKGWEPDGDFYTPGMQFRYKQSTGASFPPVNVRILVGLPTKMAYTLAELNDEEMLGFREIADWIEKNL